MADAGDARLTEAVRRAFDFVQLDDETVSGLVGASDLMELPAGEMLFQKGSPADSLYVVVSGTVRIFDVIQGNERDIAEIGPGDFTGEVSLALHTGRTRSARTGREAQILRIPARAVEQLSTTHPALGARIIEAFEARMGGREEAAAESD